MMRVNVVEDDGKFSLYNAESGFAVEHDFKHLHLAVRYANDNGMVANCFEPVKASIESVKSKKNIKRFPSFFANGFPKKVRCYDNGGESFDRFTICFFGNYRETTGGEYYALGASFHPQHPQGFGQHLTSDQPYDRPKSAHLGKKIRFSELPTDVQKWVLQDYAEFWGFMGTERDNEGMWL